MVQNTTNATRNTTNGNVIGIDFKKNENNEKH